MERMEEMKSKASQAMDALFHTGYPHPINLFATLMLTVIPLLSPWAGARLPTVQNGVAGLAALLYLIVWSRLPVFHANRAPRFFWVYLLVQTLVCSLVYVLDGGLTRFLFVVVAVQAVYISPVRRWAPYLGILAALWLTLYLVISPDPGESMVATIGMYLSYLLFAAFVTFTAVQQEKQNRVAQELLDGVDQRHHTLRAYEQRVSHRAEEEERERLAQTICTTLLIRLTTLMETLGLLEQRLTRQGAREARLEAKDVLAEVRQVVRTLRPAEEGLDEADEPDQHLPPPEPEVPYPWTDPIRVYHVWNVLVMALVLGVNVASTLVGGSPRWWHLLLAGLSLLGAYGAGALFRQPWNRTLALVIQCALIVWLVVIAQEPLINHLFVVVAAQIVFLVPTVNRWLASAVVFPTLLSGAALWLTGLYVKQPTQLLPLTAAFAVTNFFGAVMAFMTRRQVEDRQRAVIYAGQLAEVNRQLEARLDELRRVAIARERVRMAREIHDGLGHHLTIVIMELQYAEQLADEDEAGARSHIAGARQVIAAAMDTARELVENLERFERPLAEAIADLVSAWRQGNTYADVVTRLQGDFSQLSTAARVTLYRAVQESLTNIQKHTRAVRVEIDLVQLQDRVTLQVTNDDRGGALRFESARSGFGLVGLRERADALQGEFHAGPRAGGGFEVKLVLPLGA
ncbi:MAG TPA: sensor histidine kinase [Symbiobacteriaceae bacterium]|nr:sensor histidine kinase [Symbiobacteriaceae bacterium]